MKMGAFIARVYHEGQYKGPILCSKCLAQGHHASSLCTRPIECSLHAPTQAQYNQNHIPMNGEHYIKPNFFQKGKKCVTKTGFSSIQEGGGGKGGRLLPLPRSTPLPSILKNKREKSLARHKRKVFTYELS